MTFGAREPRAATRVSDRDDVKCRAIVCTARPFVDFDTIDNDVKYPTYVMRDHVQVPSSKGFS